MKDSVAAMSNATVNNPSVGMVTAKCTDLPGLQEHHFGLSYNFGDPQ